MLLKSINNISFNIGSPLGLLKLILIIVFGVFGGMIILVVAICIVYYVRSYCMKSKVTSPSTKPIPLDPVQPTKS